MIEKKKLETLPLTSVKLPKVDEIDRPEDIAFGELRDSMKEYGQIQPIVVCKITETGKWELVCGRSRLLAAHRLGWTHIDAYTGVLATMELAIAYRLQENEKRSKNIIGDYLAIKDVIVSTLSYEEAAKKFGIRTQTVAQLDKDFGKVPADFLIAGMEGKIVPSVLKQIGKLEGKPVFKSLRKKLSENEKVTANDIRELRSARQAEVTMALEGSAFFDTAKNMKTYNDAQMRWLLSIAVSNAESNCEKAIKSLLGE